ncbi:uracil-DNA glycosylase [Teredinibacter sp. KSP-S5-2]|uniref:uracil-DNA glycosylase n=1 Tax=Teredinibacter sp. KSP-S5-2 TaxID=3034506 RepID=UPI0029342DA3|nr:uracil-DNA glycosylase [Teredinibacter sp. KSP-S5-2]WNO11731.1 uracil-DNA glycosylase [Teredinibacter sp. KSP-S5-2]
MDKKVDLNESWMRVIGDEFDAPYMTQLKQFLLAEKQAGKVIYPPGKQIFNALNTTPFDQVKVVILGQDPYHGPGQAHGLCFSVLPGVPYPPSLQNIFKEIQADLGLPMPNHGCLQAWAEQGVLLLNATLTVEQAKAGSHQGKGWEVFTDSIVNALNAHRQGVVFLLWGSYAQKKGAMIDQNKHFVLRSAHPSPLSAYRGFFGCKHFSQTNQYLVQNGQSPINWSLPNV